MCFVPFPDMTCLLSLKSTKILLALLIQFTDPLEDSFAYTGTLILWNQRENFLFSQKTKLKLYLLVLANVLRI